MFNFKDLNLKRISKIIVLILIGFILSSVTNPYKYTSKQYEELNKKITTLRKNYAQLQTKNKTLQTENNSLQVKVDKASPWFKMKEEERKTEEEKTDTQIIEKKQTETKEKQGYNTGITYNQLAKNPINYISQKVKFKGKVIQVIEGTDNIQIRLAVSGNYDNILLCEYSNNIVKSKILENDYITIYGLSSGLATYQSTTGGYITIPSIAVNKIDN